MHECPTLEGYRSKAKISISSDNNIKLLAYDPIKGKCNMEEMLWILPNWGRNILIEAASIIIENYRLYQIDGFEIGLEHGGKFGHIRLNVNRNLRISYAELAGKILSSIPNLLGISIPSQKMDLGDVYLKHEILGQSLYSHYGAFFQTNIHMTSTLVNEIRSGLEFLPKQTMVDLYCGVGLHSFYNAANYSKLTGVDNNRLAIESARRNFSSKKNVQADFKHQSVEKFIKASHFEELDLAIINPTRLGCPNDALFKIVKWNPKNIAYISCSLSSHFRDLDLLKSKGYIPKLIIAFDMFPFTEFLEIFTILSPAT